MSDKEHGAPDASAAPAAAAALRGQWRYAEPSAAHVSWRAGGPLARAYFPADGDDFAAFLASLRPDEPLLVIGKGSNLLVRDGGFEGTAVFTDAALKGLRLEADGTLYAEAGVSSPKVAAFAATSGLAGAEFLAGVPGTVGGALAMNAGCYGGETWNHVVRVLMVDRRGRQVVREPGEFSVGYRRVGLVAATDEVFAAAWLRFAPGDGGAARERIRELLERRLATQPLQLPNAGSVFRNPPDDHAARLIEAAGLKGLRIGGAEVSQKHANFIVNAAGRATAAEIEATIGRVRDAVQEKFGITLVREVRIVGEALRPAEGQ